MRTTRLLAAFLAWCMGSVPAAQACSAFVVADEQEVRLAKNFDWHFGGGYLVSNPSGLARRALPLAGGDPVDWVSTFGSLTFTQYGAGLPYGGVNQRGLAIEMLWLDETVYPSAAARSIGELEWIQYQLDTRASVAEVVAAVEEFSIRPLGGKIHYLLADASGDRALVEFIDGAASVHRAGAQPLVCTNDTQRLAELSLRALDGKPLTGNSSRVRHARLWRGLGQTDGPPTVAGAFALLDTVQERGKAYRTQWSAVYELRRQRVHVRVEGAAHPFVIDAGGLDHAPASGLAYIDLFDRRAPERGFVPLTADAQLSLLKRNLPKVGVDGQLQAIAGHLLDPAASTVRPQDDRGTLHIRIETADAGAFARIAVFGNARELAEKSPRHVGSVLLTSPRRQFAFYNLPKGRYAVGGYHDTNQNNRPDDGEPIAFYRPDPAATGMDFDSIAFELDGARRTIDLAIR